MYWNDFANFCFYTQSFCYSVTYIYTIFHLVLVPFVSLRQRSGTPYLLTFCNLKLLILLDVIYFKDLLLSVGLSRPLAAIPNAPWFSSETSALHKITYLLTYLQTTLKCTKNHCKINSCSNYCRTKWRFLRHSVYYIIHTSRYLRTTERYWLVCAAFARCRAPAMRFLSSSSSSPASATSTSVAGTEHVPRAVTSAFFTDRQYQSTCHARPTYCAL